MIAFLNELHTLTLGFLVFQTGCFIVSMAFFVGGLLREIRAMNRVESRLRQLDPSGADSLTYTLNEIFSTVKNSRYQALWNRYHQRVTASHGHRGVDPDSYFGFGVMSRHLGDRAWAEVGSRLHITVGVLGTLWGLARGWSEGVMDGPGVWQPGVETALYTFLWGSLLSILWMVADRFLTGHLEKKIRWHSDRMLGLLHADEEERWIRPLEKVLHRHGERWERVLTDSFRQAMDPVIRQMQRSRDEWRKAAEQWQTEMEKRWDLLESRLRSVQHRCDKVVDRFTETMDKQETVLKVVHDLLQSVRESAAALASATPGWRDAADSLEAWKADLRQMQEQQNRLLVELLQGREQNRKLVEEMGVQMQSHVGEISTQVAAMQSHWASIREELSALQETLHRSAKGFAEEMDQGLSNTFRHFDRELSNAMQKFSQLNRSFRDIHEELLRELEELSKSLKQRNDIIRQ